MVATLPPLPYEYNGLEPYISEEIMKLHHTKHHQTYVTNLNAAEEKYVKATSYKDIIALQSAIKFNGGGHINHSLFWKNLAPSAEKGGKGGVFDANSPLGKAILAEFGSVESFKVAFNDATLAIQGSGWGWLGVNPKTKRVEITTTANQDPLVSHVPLIGVDIWEHAFYLQYKNVKVDYIKAIWSVINFEEANQRYVDFTTKNVDAGVNAVKL